MNSLELFENLETTLYQLAYVCDEAKENLNKLKKSFEIFNFIKSTCHIECSDCNMSIHINNALLVFSDKKEYETYKEILELKKDT